MKKLLIVLLLAYALVLAACTETAVIEGTESANDAAEKHYERIVSLAPSITETIFALGLEEKLVAITRFCVYPAETDNYPRISDVLEPNFEAIIALKPDIVILLEESTESVEQFRKLGIEMLQVNNRDVSSIKSSIIKIGEKCGKGTEARLMIEKIDNRLAEISKLTAGLDRPSVLISVGRAMGSNSVKDLYCAGPSTFYDELIRIAGGTNALTESIPYPKLSAEGLLQVNPDVIIDLVESYRDKGLTEYLLKDQWAVFPQLKAVKENRIIILGDSYVVVPGPRIFNLLEDFLVAIHPTIKEES